MFERSWATIVAAGALLAAAVTAQAEGSVDVDIKSRLPVSCEVTVVSSTVVTLTPLLINASVREKCNARHDLTVTYNTALVIRPTQLSITYDGGLPNVPTAGAQSFTNLPARTAVKPLVIRYSGGTLTQRRLLSQNWAITVTPR